MTFINDNFLLSNASSERLYHDYAAGKPIIDYHSHLPHADVAADRQFSDLAEIWLGGDHYKWRAMRACGLDESLITGDASGKEKFLAWAKTTPQTLRNPLYHWTHLELKRYFGIDELLNEQTAESIWERANEQLATPEFSARGILTKFNVHLVCTTDDPADSLDLHHQIADSGFTTRIYPTFRPDKALGVDQPTTWNTWVNKLGEQVNADIGTFTALCDALKNRHDAFHAVGGRLSDHGLSHCYAEDCTEAEASTIFDNAKSGNAATQDQYAKFVSYLMHYFGQLDAEKGWTKQLHLGPIRNNNTRRFETLGPDVGCDSIGDYPQAASLGAYMDKLEREDSLPKTILYNNNPNDNYPLATMAGNFQGSIAGKIQFGSGWWHLDQKEGMQQQINCLSAVGLLPKFIGMLTDSRSFLSFPRHEYFRRILCDLLGRDVENGELPRDFDLLGSMVEDICYNNAKNYLGLQIGAK